MKKGIMGLTQCGLLLLPVILALVTGQDVPTTYRYDCRRTGVDCSNNGTCNIYDGVCACADGYQGDGCDLQTSNIKTTCGVDACENNAICYDNGGTDACFCDSNTYGVKCENPRVKMWCTSSEMFININPHGAFQGKVFVNTPENDGRSKDACRLKNVTDNPVNLTANYDYVKTVQGETPKLEGYYIRLPHAPATGVDACTAAAMSKDEDDSTIYLQKVIVEYNSMLSAGVDTAFSFRCKIRQTAGDLSSENAMSVKITSNDDYEEVNSTDTIEPVDFLIRRPDGTAITNMVTLGDPLDLVFTMQTTADDNGTPAYAKFKVTNCTATNRATGADAASIDFLQNECPAPGSELLYRGNILQKSVGDLEQTVIPLSAFRFVGSNDQVAFTCQLKLCTEDDITSDPSACTKAECPTDSLTPPDTGTDGDTSTGNTTGNTTDTDTGTVNGTDTGTINGTTDGANATDGTDGANSTDTDGTGGTDGGVTGPSGVRRRRAANDREREVRQVIRVSSGHEETEEEKESPASVQDLDCMQHAQVVTVIIIFSAILCFLLLIIVTLTIRLLRSRAKVVDATEIRSETMSRYSLPRLSVATTM